VHDDYGHCGRALWLPVAVTKHLHSGLDIKEALFRRRKQIAARQEVACDSLRVAVQERAARAERLSKVIANRSFGVRGLTIGGVVQGLIVGGDDRRLLYL
jgi:hypothetical protein